MHTFTACLRGKADMARFYLKTLFNNTQFHHLLIGSLLCLMYLAKTNMCRCKVLLLINDNTNNNNYDNDDDYNDVEGEDLWRRGRR